MLFEKEIDRLYKLSKKVIENANADVRFEMGSKTYLCIISIKEKSGKGHTKNYFISKMKELREISADACKMAEEHLTRLLKENGS